MGVDQLRAQYLTRHLHWVWVAARAREIIGPLAPWSIHPVLDLCMVELRANTVAEEAEAETGVPLGAFTARTLAPLPPRNLLPFDRECTNASRDTFLLSPLFRKASPFQTHAQIPETVPSANLRLPISRLRHEKHLPHRAGRPGYDPSTLPDFLFVFLVWLSCVPYRDLYRVICSLSI